MRRAASVLVPLLALALLTAGGAAGQRPSLREVVALAGDYVRSYAEQLSAVVGQEEYVQTVTEREGASGSGGTETIARTRVLLSEIALIQVAGNAWGWEGFRDVFDVDGTPVGDRRNRFERLFSESPGTAIQQARTIADESARFNIGPVSRNFNVPTAVLFFLHPSNQHRFRFTRDGEEDVSGRPAWVVRFEERERPTIIRTPQHKDVPATGRVWAEPGSGRVVRTELRVSKFAPEANESTAKISVDYRFEQRLELWVPVEMREEYVAVSGRSESRTVCLAKYSNFRRFTTEGRLVVPK